MYNIIVEQPKNNSLICEKKLNHGNTSTSAEHSKHCNLFCFLTAGSGCVSH